MKYLKIQNNGELDIRLVALMGGTTKANNKFKIGQFNTGLEDETRKFQQHFINLYARQLLVSQAIEI